MMVLLSFIAGSRVALVTCFMAFAVLFYEGLPIGPLGKIPFMGPAFEFLTDGRVDRAQKAARAGLVNVSELAAAKAQIRALESLAAHETALRLAEEKASRRFADAFNQSLRNEADANDQIFELLAVPAPAGCMLDDDLFDRVRKR